LGVGIKSKNKKKKTDLFGDSRIKMTDLFGGGDFSVDVYLGKRWIMWLKFPIRDNATAFSNTMRELGYETGVWSAQRLGDHNYTD
jgi:hypothetical protein